jgi:hypothetical protein
LIFLDPGDYGRVLFKRKLGRGRADVFRRQNSHGLGRNGTLWVVQYITCMVVRACLTKGAKVAYSKSLAYSKSISF